jgi:serine/threonine protein kinase
MTNDPEALAHLSSDRFGVQRCLGQGGFGVVYEAYDRHRDELVAVKVLRHFSPAALYRFKREFRALADVEHVNLVALYEFFSEHDAAFFSMELIEGVDFVTHAWEARHGESRTPRGQGSVETAVDEQAVTEELKAGEPSSGGGLVEGYQVESLRKALVQLAKGLNALHGAGIVHRDIKPGNVLVTREGRVVILDFGLVSPLEPAVLEGDHVGGTLVYASPEQCEGRTLGEASDWYSVGILLYEALTGRRPYRRAVLQSGEPRRPPAPPKELRPAVPDDLSSICLELLRTDPRDRPSGQEVLRRLTHSAAEEASPSTTLSGPVRGSSLLVGRRAEVEVLRDAFVRTRRGEAAFVFVRGESGMGKTALVKEFLDVTRRASRDPVILEGRCFERESVPYQGFDHLIDTLSDYLRMLPVGEMEALLPRDLAALEYLFPVLKRATGVARSPATTSAIPDSDLRRRAFRALCELFARLAERRSLVVFIDDLQWADADSGDLLGELMRSDVPGLLWLGCLRSEARASPFLQKMLAAFQDPALAGRIHQVILEPLSFADAQDLAVLLIGGRAPGRLSEVAEAAARESGGNPFFLTELVKHAESSRPRPSGDSPVSLGDVVRARVAELGPEARHLLEIVAVAGRPVPIPVALRAAGSPGGSQHLLVRLTGQNLLRRSGHRDEGEIEAYHDRIRESVLSGMSEPALRAHHGRLAEALGHLVEGDRSALPVHCEALATHCELSGDTRSALRFLVAAADQSFRSLAFDHASSLLRRALGLAGPGEMRDLRVKLGDSLANAHRGPEAAREYAAAAEESSTLESCDLLRRAAGELLRSGHVQEGLRHLDKVLPRLGLRMPRTRWGAVVSLAVQRLRLMVNGLHSRRVPGEPPSESRALKLDTCWTVATGLGGIDLLMAAQFHNRHALLAIQSGDPFRLSRALASEACYLAMGGFRTRLRAQAVVREAAIWAKRAGEDRALGLCSLAEGQMAFCIGDWSRAQRLCEEARAILGERCTGVAWELHNAEIIRVGAQLWQGDLAAVSGRLGTLLQDVAETGDLYAETMLRVWGRAFLLLVADRVDDAEREIDVAMSRWPEGGFHVQHLWSGLRRAEIRLYAGRPAAALAEIARQRSRLNRLIVARLQVLRIQLLDLEARCHLALASRPPDGLRSRERCLAAAIRCARRIEKEATPWGGALARSVRAGVALERRQVEDATGLLLAAEHDLERLDMHLHAAVIRRRYGEMQPDEAKRRSILADTGGWMEKRGIRSPARVASLLLPAGAGEAGREG